jgi:hypothetical protein
MNFAIIARVQIAGSTMLWNLDPSHTRNPWFLLCLGSETSAALRLAFQSHFLQELYTPVFMLAKWPLAHSAILTASCTAKFPTMLHGVCMLLKHAIKNLPVYEVRLNCNWPYKTLLQLQASDRLRSTTMGVWVSWLYFYSSSRRWSSHVTWLLWLLQFNSWSAQASRVAGYSRDYPNFLHLYSRPVSRCRERADKCF